MGMPRITNGGPERAGKRTLGERGGDRANTELGVGGSCRPAAFPDHPEKISVGLDLSFRLLDPAPRDFQKYALPKDVQRVDDGERRTSALLLRGPVPVVVRAGVHGQRERRRRASVPRRRRRRLPCARRRALPLPPPHQARLLQCHVSIPGY